jgi:P-type Ca2+ transporter type 2C
MVLFENVHAFNVRSETRSAFRVPLAANRLLVAAVVAAQAHPYRVDVHSPMA